MFTFPATFLSSPPVVSGDYSTQSLEFDGSTEYIDFGNIFDYASTDAFSLSAWINMDDSGVFVIMSKYRTSAFDGWIFRVVAGELVIYLRRASARLYTKTVATIPTGSWHHVGISKTTSALATGMNMYIDGVAVTKTTVNNNLTGSMTNTDSFKIGRRNTNYADGKIDSLSVWDKALSAAEFTEIYNLGKPGDLSTHSASANLNLRVRGEGDTSGTDNVIDHSGSGNHGTMINMDSSNVVTDTP